MPDLSPISLAAGGIGELFKGIFGAYQMIHGNKKLNDLEANKPEYQIDPNIQYNQQFAGQLASQGIPDSAKNWYTDSIERGLGSTIQAAKETGQGLGSITTAFGSSNDAFRQLLALDAEQKQKNAQLLMGANKDMAAENLKAFDYNKNIPYQNAYNRWSSMTNSGATNIFGATQGLSSNGQMWGDYLNNKDNG